MRDGGGKAKGSGFERDTCRRLSRWITHGKRDDLLARNVLSGGQFTAAHNTGKTRGSPGDLTAIDPLAIAFIQSFSIECKHYADIGIDTFIWDENGTSHISKWIALCRSQGLLANKKWLLVVKQDRRRALIFMEKKAAQVAIVSDNGRLPLRRRVHTFDEGSRYEASMMFFEDFLRNVDAEKFTKGCQ